MVEDKLIIPEEFKNYLNQVADIESNATNRSPAHVMDDKSNELNQNSAIANNAAHQNTATAASANSQNNQALNVHGWRNPTSSLYPMSSPLTQPQSPASVISQIMPSSPQHLLSGMCLLDRFVAPVRFSAFSSLPSILPLFLRIGQSPNNMSLPNQLQSQMPHHQMQQPSPMNGNFENHGYSTSTNHQPPPYPMYYNNQQTHSEAAGAAGAAAGPTQLPYNNYSGCKHNNSSQYPMNSTQMHPPNGMYSTNMNYANSTINNANGKFGETPKIDQYQLVLLAYAIPHTLLSLSPPLALCALFDAQVQIMAAARMHARKCPATTIVPTKVQ